MCQLPQRNTNQDEFQHFEKSSSYSVKSFSKTFQKIPTNNIFCCFLSKKNPPKKLCLMLFPIHIITGRCVCVCVSVCPCVRVRVSVCPSLGSLTEVNKGACPLWYFWYAPPKPPNTHTFSFCCLSKDM